MITIACVLRSGGVYTPEWVYALKRAINRFLPEYQFACLTDADCMPLWAYKLRYDWPGWWAKLELFRPGVLSGPVLYMDLDTLPVGPLDELAGYRGEFAMISDFYVPQKPQSGVMAFTPGSITEAIWHTFSAKPEEYMRSFRGDGEFLAAVTKPQRLQNIYPHQIVSYKAHARTGIPRNARLVCGHGLPRFSDPLAGWAFHHWNSLHLDSQPEAVNG